MSGRPASHSLVVRRQFRAPQHRVFEAWTTPEHLKRWWGPMGCTTDDVRVELHNGGQYRLGMLMPDGKRLAIVGTFVDIEPNQRLVYTWAFENNDQEHTLVTVEFRALGDVTEVVLTHERFSTSDDAQHHTTGWEACFDGLEAMLGEGSV